MHTNLLVSGGSPDFGTIDGLLATTADGIGTSAWAGVAAVGVIVLLGLVMIVRNSVLRRRGGRIPAVVRDLEARGYLTVYATDGPHGPDWTLRRLRMPDRTLTATERAWYFAVFGTTLTTVVHWSEVRPPSVHAWPELRAATDPPRPPRDEPAPCD
ncbi:hypothetical protein [Cellulomonas gilvus]|uniref:Uncharacterized protein n=1 Tax=Cellulomonas gilvus (strain ATCC 13127 / NRRL B-14078) TaxID=593907 RepID=F8A144_CELGA|nr:hypothetical protein [Cellulomonas gilvus]AEI12802.1 hypothetical protein Celgi_2302 [Cellulomonas gilvus ATCC 13127]